MAGTETTQTHPRGNGRPSDTPTIAEVFGGAVLRAETVEFAIQEAAAETRRGFRFVGRHDDLVGAAAIVLATAPKVVGVVIDNLDAVLLAGALVAVGVGVAPLLRETVLAVTGGTEVSAERALYVVRACRVSARSVAIHDQARVATVLGGGMRTTHSWRRAVAECAAHALGIAQLPSNIGLAALQ